MLSKIQKVFTSIQKNYVRSFLIGGFFFFLIKGVIWIFLLITVWFEFLS
jgi:hypothetical protein